MHVLPLHSVLNWKILKLKQLQFVLKHLFDFFRSANWLVKTKLHIFHDFHEYDGLTEWTFGKADLFSQTSSVGFDSNDRTIFLWSKVLFSLLCILQNWHLWHTANRELISGEFWNSIGIDILRWPQRLTKSCQINGEDFVKFCGPLRKHEL